MFYFLASEINTGIIVAVIGILVAIVLSIRQEKIKRKEKHDEEYERIQKIRQVSDELFIICKQVIKKEIEPIHFNVFLYKTFLPHFHLDVSKIELVHLMAPFRQYIHYLKTKYPNLVENHKSHRIENKLSEKLNCILSNAEALQKSKTIRRYCKKPLKRFWDFCDNINRRI